MRLERLSHISNDYFSVKTSKKTTLADFTREIASQYESFAGLLPNNPKEPPYTVEGSRQSTICLGEIVIEIEQIGCYSESSDEFIINTQDRIDEKRLKEFQDHLKRNMNGKAHQKYLF